jgi:AP-3 complex subunit sigma
MAGHLQQWSGWFQVRRYLSIVVGPTPGPPVFCPSPISVLWSHMGHYGSSRISNKELFEASRELWSRKNTGENSEKLADGNSCYAGGVPFRKERLAPARKLTGGSACPSSADLKMESPYGASTCRRYGDLLRLDEDDQRGAGLQQQRPAAADQVLYPTCAHPLPDPFRTMRTLTTTQDTAVQQRLLSEIFTLVSARPISACNFLPLPPLLAPSQPASSSSSEHNDAPSLVTYRHFATLYFIVISTSTESPLALLDFIQCFVEALDRLFENVCELDLIFNFETLHAVLAEMIVGGVVVEIGLDKVVEGVRAQGKLAKRPVNETRGGLGVQGIWAGR